MHRDAIEPGITSDIGSISPRGGSLGKTSTERMIGAARGDLAELRSLVNDLRKRVKQLEEKQSRIITPENDYTDLIRILDQKYLIKNGSAQNVASNVTFSGPISFTNAVTISGPFGLAYGWSIVVDPTTFWTYKNGSQANQVA